MREILESLADVPGVRGSLVVTLDGMVVDSLLGGTLDNEIVGAMAAGAIQGTKRAVEKAGLETFSQFSMVSTHGKMVVSDTGSTYLIVLLDRKIDLGAAELEIRSAVRRVERMDDDI
ncbi:MAG: roadblock/LC7 domain-containing protein [Planctomycetota bacterium]|jgi:predicted regulator of Ras-like GTPase activity (Roadblock/LC7/MglB family)